MWSEERSQMNLDISQAQEDVMYRMYEEAINEVINRNRVNGRLEERENVVSISLLLI